MMAAGAIVDVARELPPLDPEAGIANVDLIFLVRGMATTRTRPEDSRIPQSRCSQPRLRHKRN